MTVDLSKARATDTVHFRAGGSAVIGRIENGNILFFNGCEQKDICSARWYGNGCYEYDNQHPFDIIRIEQKAFDWKDVKPGMAFKYEARIVWFACLLPTQEESHAIVMSYRNEKSNSLANPEGIWRYRELLTRAPEHDIEVRHG